MPNEPSHGNEVNSAGYWESRFQRDWESRGGPNQTRFFAELAFAHLPGWFVARVTEAAWSWADWGCAEGDGAEPLRKLLKARSMTGIDWSGTAIQKAAAKYPGCTFLSEDWLKFAPEADRFDAVFCSNTLEHFREPGPALSLLARTAKKALVVLVPFDETRLIAEHEVRFTHSTLPFMLDEKLVLAHYEVINTVVARDTCWDGEQLLAVYVSVDEAARLTPADLVLQLPRSPQSQGPGVQLEAMMRQLREEQQAHRQRVIEQARQFDEEAAAMRRRLAEAEESRRQLATALQQVEAQFAEVRTENFKKEASRSWRLTAPLRAVAHQVREARRATGSLTNQLRMSRLQREQTGIELPTAAVPREVPATPVVPAGLERRPIFGPKVVIFAGVPFDDVGGGQRSAQFARALVDRGHAVHYVYLYKRYDFQQQRVVDSQVSVPLLTHSFIDDLSPERMAAAVEGDTVAIFELPHPRLLPYLEQLERIGVRCVYELIDDWDTSLGGDWYSRATHQQFVEKADVVVGTARLLVSRLVEMGRSDALYLPNAANDRIFDLYGHFPRPADLPTIRGRVFLYFGSLYGEWFGWDYVRTAARANPHDAFVLIGEAPRGVAVEPNMFLLGPKPIDALPAYLAHSAAALLPFIPGKISEAVSPIKVFEYLAMGKVVVATQMPELEGYPNVVQCGTEAAFAAACADLPAPREVEAFISENTWASRLDRLLPAAGGPPRISLVILIHNNERIISRCLETVLRHGEGFLKEVIVVDNASTDGGAAVVEARFPTVKLIRNPKNGCSSGRNLGLRVATGDIIGFLDSDQWLTSRGSFEEAVTLLDRHPAVGAIGWAAGWFEPTHKSFAGPLVDYLARRGTEAPEYLEVGFRSDIGYLGTGAMFVKRSVLTQCAGFDEGYDPTCFEDTDISLQIVSRGFLLAYRDFTGVRHQPHQTTGANSNSKRYEDLFLRNAEYFRKKWEHRPDLLRRAPRA